PHLPSSLAERPCGHTPCSMSRSSTPPGPRGPQGQTNVTHLGSASRARFLAISLGSLALITIGCGGGGHTAPDAFTLDLFPGTPDMQALPDVAPNDTGQGGVDGSRNDGGSGNDVANDSTPPNDVPV